MAADPETTRLDDDILAFIREGGSGPSDESRFNALALRLFAYQFGRNPAYRSFCVARNVTPEQVTRWHQVPAVPTMAFKELPVACFAVQQAAVVYLSSGTTGSKPSAHYLPSLDLYNASLKTHFSRCVLPDRERMPMIVLALPPRVLPHSSLSHMLEVVRTEMGTPDSDYFMDEGGIDLPRLVSALRDAEKAGRPLCLLGTAFAFVHFLDHCRDQGLRFVLPPGSRIMDTGGYKGKSREVPKAELHGLYQTTLGIPPDYLINEYGMTEMGSQFYDNSLVDTGKGRPRFKLAPPWARTLVVDPERLEPVPRGQAGLLRHYDLANRGSAMVVQTDDMGVEIEEGFEILGRASGAEARGCSIASDELLSRAG